MQYAVALLLSLYLIGAGAMVVDSGCAADGLSERVGKAIIWPVVIELQVLRGVDACWVRKPEQS